MTVPSIIVVAAPPPPPAPPSPRNADHRAGRRRRRRWHRLRAGPEPGRDGQRRRPARGLLDQSRRTRGSPASVPLKIGDVSTSLLVASLVPCVHWRSFAGCGLLTGGALRAAGHGLVDSRQVVDPYFALGARLALELRMAGKLPDRPRRRIRAARHRRQRVTARSSRTTPPSRSWWAWPRYAFHTVRRSCPDPVSEGHPVIAGPASRIPGSLCLGDCVCSEDAAPAGGAQQGHRGPDADDLLSSFHRRLRRYDPVAAAPTLVCWHRVPRPVRLSSARSGTAAGAGPATPTPDAVDPGAAPGREPRGQGGADDAHERARQSRPDRRVVLVITPGRGADAGRSRRPRHPLNTAYSRTPAARGRIVAAAVRRLADLGHMAMAISAPVPMTCAPSSKRRRGTDPSRDARERVLLRLDRHIAVRRPRRPVAGCGCRRIAAAPAGGRVPDRPRRRRRDHRSYRPRRQPSS